MVGGSSVITPEDVLQTLMNDGTIDAIRLKIINQLKANEVLKKDTITLVEHSKVLNAPGAEKQTKRELFDALRQELEAEALEKASKSIWELILDKDGLGKEINETVEKVFCRLSGRDPPLFPPNETQKDKVNGEHNLEKENEENKLEKEKVKEKNKSEKGKMDGKKKLEKPKVNEKKKLKKLKENENCNSSPKKRNFSEISNELEEGEIAGGSGVSSSRSRDSALARRTVSSDCGNSMEDDRRCKRTDGKTWRCTKEAVLDGKYCEKHMYRSSRSKKQVEATTSKKRVEISIPAKKKVKTTTPKRELEITTRSKKELPKKELEITTRSKKEMEITTRSKKELEITTRSKKQVEMTTQAPISNIASYSNIPISTPSQANTSEEDDDENSNSDKIFSAAPRMGSSPKAVIVSAEDSSPKAALVSAEDSSPKATLASIERSFPKAAVVSAEDSSPTAALVTTEDFFPKSAVVSMEASSHTAALVSAEGSSLKAAVVNVENSSPKGALVSAEGSSPKGVFASAEGLATASFGSADCQKVSY